MFRRILLSALVLFLHATMGSSLEYDSRTISLSGGIISRLRGFDLCSGPVMPEVQADGPLFFPRLHWGFTWAYWDALKPAPDMRIAISAPYEVIGARTTYSMSGHILGARLLFLAPRNPRNPATLGIFAGVSRQFLRERFTRGTVTGWERGSEWGPAYNTLDLGITITSPIRGPFSLRIETRIHRPFRPREDYIRINRGVATLGLAYTFPR